MSETTYDVLKRAGALTDDQALDVLCSLGQATTGNQEHAGIWRRALLGIIEAMAGPGRQPERLGNPDPRPAPQFKRRPDPTKGLPSIFRKPR